VTPFEYTPLMRPLSVIENEESVPAAKPSWLEAWTWLAPDSLNEVICEKSRSNVTGEFDATLRRSIETVSSVAEMNLPVAPKVIRPVPTTVLTPVAGWLSGDVANQRNVVTPPCVDSSAVVSRTVSGIPRLSYTTISEDEPSPVTCGLVCEKKS